MALLQDRRIVVVGGTGNVGAFIVQALLERGATVIVPSRSQQHLHELRAFLSASGHSHTVDQLHTLVGNIGDQAEASALEEQITALVGVPDSVVASLGRWHAVPSLLAAQTADLERVLQDYLLAHFVAARTFLPGLRATAGTYVMINGPLAFEIWPHAHSALVSTATAAQHMLFRALAQELEGSSVRVVELVNHAFLRDKQTQPGSPLPGEAVGAYVAHLLSDIARDVHGRSIQLDSNEALSRPGITIAP